MMPDLTEEELQAPPAPNPRSRLRAKQNPVAPFLAARTVYNDIRARRISEDLAIRCAKHLEDVSPAGARLLWAWLRSIVPI